MIPGPMLLEIFAERFPQSFHDHVARLRSDRNYRCHFEAAVEKLGKQIWYKSPKWKLTVQLRKLINPCCQMCGTKENLHCHHRTYMHFGVEVLYIEDLEILCDKCHAKRHGRTDFAYADMPSKVAQMELRFPGAHEDLISDEDWQDILSHEDRLRSNCNNKRY